MEIKSHFCVLRDFFVQPDENATPTVDKNAPKTERKTVKVGETRRFLRINIKIHGISYNYIRITISFIADRCAKKTHPDEKPSFFVGVWEI